MMAEGAARKDALGVEAAITEFLAYLTHTNRAVRTRQVYASDLHQFGSFYRGALAGISAEILRTFFATWPPLKPATRARKQAALASFLAWAYRQDLIAANPMAKLDRVKRDPAQPRGLKRTEVEAILPSIPAKQQRDRLLFRLIVETGLRVGEALALYLEDLDLTPDDEHLRVVGKGGRRRTVLLDDPVVVGQLRGYLKQTGFQHGPLFRASKNGRGGPLRYQSVQVRWAQYCAQAGVACTLHQLRHTHATELVNAGVSLATIRKRLGHQNVQTTLRYAEQSDTTADTEVRAWRRQRHAQDRDHEHRT